MKESQEISGLEIKTEKDRMDYLHLPLLSKDLNIYFTGKKKDVEEKNGTMKDSSLDIQVNIIL